MPQLLKMSNNEAYLYCIEMRYNMQGIKKTQKNTESTLRRRDIAARVAEIHGVTADHVRKVMRGDRENELILTTCMHFIESDNLLIQAVKNILPFQVNPNSGT